MIKPQYWINQYMGEALYLFLPDGNSVGYWRDRNGWQASHRAIGTKGI